MVNNYTFVCQFQICILLQQFIQRVSSQVFLIINYKHIWPDYFYNKVLNITTLTTSMLQFAAVVTTGGLLLFSTVIKIDQTIILSLVNRIIDSKNLQASFIIQTFKIHYLYDAILGLVYVIAWRKEIDLQYPQKLLKSMSIQWKDIYDRIIKKDDLILDSPNFQEPWDRAFNNWKAYLNEKQQQGRKMKTFQDKNKKKSTIKQEKQQEAQKADQKNQQTNAQQSQNKSKDDEWQSLSPRQRFLRKQKQSSKIKSPKKSQIIEAKSQVRNRQSFDHKINKKTLQQLDRSQSEIRDRSRSPKMEQKYIDQEKDQKVAGFLDSDQESDDDTKQNSFLNKWVGKFKNVVGDKQITKQDLSEVLTQFKQKLMEKNVAQDVAIQISDAVGATLLQQKTKSFTSVHKTVKQAMKQALRKLLTPKRKIDLIVEVTKEREKLKPYVIVFVGVNGVGKSTNLAKVAYKLKNAKLSVMLAACDNFRAGAVQQIQTHGRNLDIPVFQKGYKQQPANIAYEAIKDATKKRIDAVLVDTAGRMQDNQPLMKQLARLVKLNKPNLVVFIGQALVGNGAVDQITKFNKALEDQSTAEFTPQIDAILLSKFDTVDDKVGTALSLVYSTSKPILFVGIGQKYPNLKQLNVNTVVHALLS